jgi:hypothetical protein
MADSGRTQSLISSVGMSALCVEADVDGITCASVESATQNGPFAVFADGLKFVLATSAHGPGVVCSRGKAVR